MIWCVVDCIQRVVGHDSANFQVPKRVSSWKLQTSQTRKKNLYNKAKEVFENRYFPAPSEKVEIMTEIIRIVMKSDEPSTELMESISDVISKWPTFQLFVASHHFSDTMITEIKS